MGFKDIKPTPTGDRVQAALDQLREQDIEEYRLAREALMQPDLYTASVISSAFKELGFPEAADARRIRHYRAKIREGKALLD